MGLVVLEDNSITKNIIGITFNHGTSTCSKQLSEHTNGKRIYKCSHEQKGKHEICNAEIKKASYYVTNKEGTYTVDNKDGDPCIVHQYFHIDIDNKYILGSFKTNSWSGDTYWLIDIEVVKCEGKMNWSLSYQYKAEQEVIKLKEISPAYWGNTSVDLISNYRNAFTKDQLIEYFLSLHCNMEFRLNRHEEALKEIVNKMNQAGNCLTSWF